MMRVEQDETSRDVRSVRIANGDQLLRAEVVSLRSRLNELRQLFGPELEVLDIENAFREAAKETRHAIFQDLAS